MFCYFLNFVYLRLAFGKQKKANFKTKVNKSNKNMPAIAKPLPKDLLKRLRKMARPMGGMTEIAKLTGLTQPGVAGILKSKKATEKSLEKLKKLEEAA